MTERMYRTQILLDPAQHHELAELARREGRSVSSLVREMIGQQLNQRRQADLSLQEQRLAALEEVRQHRQAILARRGGVPLNIDVAQLIAELREEQDERNLGCVQDDRG